MFNAKSLLDINIYFQNCTLNNVLKKLYFKTVGFKIALYK